MAEKLAKLLLRENVISNSMLEIYQYGFLRMLEIGSAVLTSFAICLIMGMLKEGIIFFAFFVPLRSYLGGFHLGKYWQCYIMSCLTFLLALAVTKSVSPDAGLSSGIIVITSIGIGLEAKAEQKKQESKVYSFVVWFVLLVLLAVTWFGMIQNKQSLLVLLCCVTTIVLISKVLEQILQYKKNKCNH